MIQRKENHLILAYVFAKLYFLFLLLLFSESRKVVEKFNSFIIVSICIRQTLFSSDWKLLPAQRGESSCWQYNSINTDPIFVIM